LGADAKKARNGENGEGEKRKRMGREMRKGWQGRKRAGKRRWWIGGILAGLRLNRLSFGQNWGGLDERTDIQTYGQTNGWNDRPSDEMREHCPLFGR
jgi:hypothetical protein